MDYLVPPDAIIQPDYYRLLARKLLVAAAPYGQVIDIRPGLQGETALMLCSSDPPSAYVRLIETRPERKLWYAAPDNQYHFPRDSNVRVNRRDALLPRDTAVAVSEAIKRMLQQRRLLPKTNDVVLDERLIQLAVPTAKPAILTPYASGYNSRTLRQVIDNLEKYFEVPSSAQPALAQRIALEAITIGKD